MIHLGLFRRRFGLVVVVALLPLAMALIHPADASAYTVFRYAQGYNGAGQPHRTPGYGPREFNRVYHHYGSTWEVCYSHTNGSWGSCAYGYINPLWDYQPDGYAIAWCFNIDDDSGVQWTCQTTQP